MRLQHQPGNAPDARRWVAARRARLGRARARVILPRVGRRAGRAVDRDLRHQ